VSPFVVVKFGGTSVATLTGWRSIASVIEARLEEGAQPVLVHSALRGVTDRLQDLADGAESDPARAINEIAELHRRLAAEMGVDDTTGLEREVDRLRAAAKAAAEYGDPTPAAVAAVLACGERLASALGTPWLRSRGLDVVRVDAPDLLTSTPGPGGPSERDYLSAVCASEPDPALQTRLSGLGAVILTQGFTARHPDGATVVLGRGGSDTAAAYLAARLDADRLELWSDVPGMFTADPRRIPSARLIRVLDYAEAQEIATTGSRVLHPRCIPALRARRIPIHLRSTHHPDLQGTEILPAAERHHAHLKALSRKDDVVLLTMETLGMWQEVGFLSRAFAMIAEAGLSIDLVSTSETSVTASLDASANLLDRALLADVVERLSAFCRVEVIPACSAISLVGRNVRGLLHRLGPALEIFDEHRIHMVSLASSDLNLTFVVDQAQADRVVERLHAILLVEAARTEPDGPFGPPWSRIVEGDVGTPTQTDRWWRRRRDELIALAEDHDGAFVYDLETVRGQMAKLLAIGPVSRVMYAMKANPHPDVLRTVREAGGGFECVSPGEVHRLESVFPGLRPDEVVFTPNFAPRSDYTFALDRGLAVTLDALHPLQNWPEIFEGRDVLLRIDPGWGSGHHEKVVTGGRHSKFGIPHFEIDEARALVDRIGARVVGLHTHSGSGILEPRHWTRVGERLAELARAFPEVRIVNVGGGLGVPERDGLPPLPLEALGRGLAEVKERHPHLDLWLEPGRFVVAEAGVLLGRVTQIKGKPGMRYVGLTVGMNSLIRPALYGAYHEIVNLTRLDAPPEGPVQIVGPICESGDRLGTDRPFPESREGDVVLVAQAGAYGRVMSSEYNLRPPATEVVLGRPTSPPSSGT
jgi:diaminopimelate decarboxylase/aspartate kinase